MKTMKIAALAAAAMLVVACGGAKATPESAPAADAAASVEAAAPAEEAAPAAEAAAE